MTVAEEAVAGALLVADREIGSGRISALKGRERGRAHAIVCRVSEVSEVSEMREVREVRAAGGVAGTTGRRTSWRAWCWVSEGGSRVPDSILYFGLNVRSRILVDLV